MMSATKGFTLLELLVVIAIIGLLAVGATAGFSVAKEKAMDIQRITELKQLKIALDLYHIDHGHYPRQSEGANGRIGEGGTIDVMLLPYMKSVPYDPVGAGDPTYYYYYDGNATCGGTGNVVVVFAFNLQQQAGNGSSLCTVWGGEGGSGTGNAYHVIAGLSD
jgi:general secretion pathway protein G